METSSFRSTPVNLEASESVAARRPSLPSITINPDASSSACRSALLPPPGPYNQLPSISKALSGSLSAPLDSGIPLAAVDENVSSKSDPTRLQHSIQQSLPAQPKSERDGFEGDVPRGPQEVGLFRHDHSEPHRVVEGMAGRSPKTLDRSRIDVRRPTLLASNSAPSGQSERWPSYLSDCSSCGSSRGLVQEIVSNLLILDLELHGKGDTDVRPPDQRAPEVARDGTYAALKWASDNILMNLHNLRRPNDNQVGQLHLRAIRESWDHYPHDASLDSKRKYERAHHEGENAISKRTRSENAADTRCYDYSRIQDGVTSHFSVDPHRESQPATQNIPYFSSTPTSTGTTQANLSPRYLASSPQVASTQQLAAQETYTQDLQHQLSVKTIAFQTLQREHDNLLQKLERQRAKCNTLERKFEVTDTEINSLTDEKERLQSQVTALEDQVVETSKARDEARSQSVANNGQYMMIMQMSSRLQQNATEDKKVWNAERRRLEAQIEELKNGRVDTVLTNGGKNQDVSGSPFYSNPSLLAYGGAEDDRRAARSISLVQQVETLRRRNQQLEQLLQQVKEAGRSLGDAFKMAQDKSLSLTEILFTIDGTSQEVNPEKG